LNVLETFASEVLRIDPVLQETDQPSLVDRVEVGPDVRIENEIHLLALSRF
jgi:hypothetical protein